LANETFALVGSDSLLGREIRDLAATGGPEIQLRLIAADEEQAGALTRVGDEPTVVEFLQADSVMGARGVFLAGSTASGRKALQLVEDGTPIIDLTGVAEDRADARLRAPMVESEEEDAAGAASVHVVAHPAAIALALFLRRVHHREPIHRAVVQILAPASEHGSAGVTELQLQTISLLSFKPLPQTVFGAQSAFSLLAGYGEDAPVKLEDSELRIERHLASLLALTGDGEDAPMPSLRLIQAPVFHGYSFSVWVEFDDEPDFGSLEGSLASGSIEVRSAEYEPPNNVGQAGQSGIAVGAITPDRNNPQACWFWIACDNLRLAAENALGVAREL
jgi:aspartate-semialdehyde dehydrogenase